MLHGPQTSSLVVPVLALFEQLDAADRAQYSLQAVSTASGDHLSATSLRRNPTGKVPSFEDADVQMWDTNSIMRYVCTKHELEQWLPSSPERRALCELGLDFSTVVADTLTKLAHADLGYGLATMALDMRATLLERAGGEVFPTLDALIRSAGSGGFVGGASPCIADLAIGIALEYARAALDERLSPLVWPPSLVAYLERMRGALGDAVFSTAVEPMIAAASRAKASAAKTRA